MEVDDIYKLLEKYQKKQCTPEEEERIERWYRTFDEHVEKMPQVPEWKLEQLWCIIENRIDMSSRVRYLKVALRYAAVVVVLVAVGLTYFLSKEQENEASISMAQEEILPAHGVTVLELSDGRQVVLTSAEMIFEQEGQVIRNDSTKILDYTSVKETEDESPMYNKSSYWWRVSNFVSRWDEGAFKFLLFS